LALEFLQAVLNSKGPAKCHLEKGSILEMGPDQTLPAVNKGLTEGLAQGIF